MNKLEKLDFLRMGGTLLRIYPSSLQIKARTMQKDWHIMVDFSRTCGSEGNYDFYNEKLHDIFNSFLENKLNFKRDIII